MTGFDPYYEWLGIPPEEQPPHAYRLLGIRPFEANPTAIGNAADQRMAFLRTVQAGKQQAAAAQLLNEVAQAQIVLLDPQRKAQCDAQLRARLNPQAPARPRTTARPLPVPGVPAPRQPQGVVSASADSRTPQIELGFSPEHRSASSHRRKKQANLTPLVAVGVSLLVLAIVVVWAKGVAGRRQMDVAAAQRPHARTEQPRPRNPARPPDVDAPSSNVDAPQPRAIAPRSIIHPAVRPSVQDAAERLEGAERSAELPVHEGEGEGEGEDAPKSSDRAIPDSGGEEPREVGPITLTAEAMAAIEGQSKVELVERAPEHLQQLFEAASTPMERSNAAKEFCTAAQQTVGDAELQYALLKIARDLAVTSGDAVRTFEAIDVLGANFEVDPLKMKEDALHVWAEKLSATFSNKELKAKSCDLGELVLELAAEVREDHQFAAASRLYRLAGEQFQAGGNTPDRKRALDLAAATEACQELTDAGEKALKQLESTPEDAAANLAAGKYLCLVKNKWKRGLAKIAKGPDSKLREAAVKEFAGAVSPAEYASFGDLWWSLGGRGETYEQQRYRERAVEIYRQVRELLTGGVRKRIESRLATVEKVTTHSREYLADLEPLQFKVWSPRGGPATSNLKEGMLRCYGASFTCNGVPVLHGVFAHPDHSNSNAFISYQLGKGYRHLTGWAAIRDDVAPRTPLTFRIVGDGRQLWNSVVARSGQAEPFRVNVKGVTHLELFVDCPGNAWDAHAVWIDPVLIKN